MQPGLPVKTFNVAAAATGAGTSFALPARRCSLQWQTFFGTDPSALTIDLQFSFDGSHWDTIDSSSVLTGEVRTFAAIGGAPGFVRGNVIAITGGAGVSMWITAQP